MRLFTCYNLQVIVIEMVALMCGFVIKTVLRHLKGEFKSGI